MLVHSLAHTAEISDHIELEPHN
uniref:Uncharacterized protein n=1 Tax=Anguilla anguilla TaxID=7936 RepID=A0A0E9QFK3_ANGAN